MAFIRARTTGKVDKRGEPIQSFQVVWREPVRDDFGAPTGKFKQTSETFDTERKAKAHQRQIETELESAKGIDPSSQRAKANKPLGFYAKQYLDSLAGQIDPSTITGYTKLYRTHIAQVFGSRPVVSITSADVARFRAELLAPHERRSFVTRGKPATNRPGGEVVRSTKTVKQIIGTLKRILDTAQDDQAIASNPVISGRRRTTKQQGATSAKSFEHHPLTSAQVAAVADFIAKTKRSEIYALATVFAAYTGVRAAELQGLQVADVTLSEISGTAGAIRVERTATKSGGQWSYGTPKSAKSHRTVPLTSWLADDMRDYLAKHPMAHIPHAPLFPGRLNRYEFDWAKPIVADNVYDNYLQPACNALGLSGVRWHDLRHTFATMALSAGEHYMQVSKWLGHSSYVLTLTTYADYIREDDTAAPMLARPTVTGTNVVPIQKKA